LAGVEQCHGHDLLVHPSIDAVADCDPCSVSITRQLC
jgi:hypothetical protein